MNVKDALGIGGLANGNIVAGANGVSRNVSTIEVMEVPEVTEWATPGVLVLTAFYSIGDDSNKQMDILRGLIDREAAGIVIKLGRFVDEIPAKVKNMANEFNFPVITISKNVVYNDVLTPINNRLFQEKQQIKTSPNELLDSFDFSKFHTFYDALEYISDRLSSPLFLEDTNGRLLYHSQSFQGDTWREDFQLFSKPSYSSHSELLSEWNVRLINSSYLFADLPGQRNRLLLPLVWKDELFSILHIVQTDRIKDKSTLIPMINKINDNISPLFMIEQINQQKKRMSDIDWVQKLSSEKVTTLHKQIKGIVQLYDRSLLSLREGSDLIDYKSIIHNKLHNFIQASTDERVIVLYREEEIFAVILGKSDQSSQVTSRMQDHLKKYNCVNDSDLKIAISTTIPPFEEIDELFNIVRKTMEIGIKVMPQNDLYKYEEMGIYVILLELTSNEFTKTYTENLLLPLKNDPDLLETLKVYLDVNGNISKTSKQLFVHRRTTEYRIDRVSELLKMDLKDSTNRFTLKFAFMIQNLIQ